MIHAGPGSADISDDGDDIEEIDTEVEKDLERKGDD